MKRFIDSAGRVFTEVEIRILHNNVSFKDPSDLGYKAITSAADKPKEVYDYTYRRVQEILDNSSKTRGYDGILSECSYYGDGGAFGNEAAIAIAWRSAVWEFVDNNIDEMHYKELLEKLPEYNTVKTLLFTKGKN